MQWQLIYKVYKPQGELERYQGFLPDILNKPGLLNKLANHEQLSPEQLEYLSLHRIIEYSHDSKSYDLRLPIFSREYAQFVLESLQEMPERLVDSTGSVVDKTRNKLSETWQQCGHLILGQLVVDGIWHKLWIRHCGGEQTASVSVFGVDAPFFTTEVIPLQEDAVLTYWQTPLISDHPAVGERLRHKDSVLTFRSLMRDSTVVLYGSAYANLLSLNVIQNRRVDGKPMVYVVTPQISADMVRSITPELLTLAKVFLQQTQPLEEKAAGLYRQRPPHLKAISYLDYRYGVFAILSYCLVQLWLEQEYLPQLHQPSNQRWATPVARSN